MATMSLWNESAVSRSSCAVRSLVHRWKRGGQQVVAEERQSTAALPPPPADHPSTRICCGITSNFTAGDTMVSVPW